MAGIWLPQRLRGQPQGSVDIAPAWRDDIAWLIHGGSGLDLVSRLAAGWASPTSLISGTDPYQWSGRGHGHAGHYLSAYHGAGIVANIFSRWRHNPGHNFSTGDFSVLVLASNPAEALSGNFLSNQGGNEQWRFQTNHLANGTSGGAVSSGALSFMTYSGAAFTSVGAAGMLDGKPHAYLFVRRGTVHELWRDGALITTQTGTVRNVTGSKVVGPAMYWHLNGLDTFTGGSVYAGNQRLYMSAAWRRAVDGRVSADPWSVFAPRRVWVPVSAGGSGTTLAQADASHAHTAETVTLTTSTTLAVADCVHAHTADNLTLSATGSASLTVADANHAHTAEAVVLGVAGATTLAVADATHAHAVDGVVLTTDSLLAIQEALHAHTAEALDLSGAPVLLIAEALHAHTSDGLALTVDAWLVVADALHGHTADAVVLTVAGASLSAQARYTLTARRRRLTITA